MEVAAFLARHAPFDAMEPDRLEELAGRVKTEQFPAGTVILQQSGEPSRFLYLMRHGSAEILDDGHLVDLLGEGEVFGAWSLLGGFGPTATVRAREDATCFLIEPDDAKEILGTAQGMTFVVSSLRRGLVDVSRGRDTGAADRYRRVASLVRRPAVTCEAATTVADAAELMAREHLSSLLIPRDDGLGIFTDRDLRTRIVGARRSLETPVGEVMTFPASTASQDAMAGEVLLLMLDEGFHHAPIVDASGTPIGVVTDTDLLGLGKATPFALKSSIERAPDRDSAVQAARGLPDVVCSLVDVGDGSGRRRPHRRVHDRCAHATPPRPGDRAFRGASRAVGLARARQRRSPGAGAAHRPGPRAGVRPPGTHPGGGRPLFRRLRRVRHGGARGRGYPPLQRRRDGRQQRAPQVDRGMDRRLQGVDDRSGGGGKRAALHRLRLPPGDGSARRRGPARRAPPYLQALPQLPPPSLAPGARGEAPTGFFKDLVVESKGKQAGRLDIKHKGITVIGNLARAASIRAGLTEKRTIGRLRAAAEVGAIDDETRAELEEAFRFLWGIRLKHHVARVRAGEPPDDFVDPSELGPVTRQALKEAFKVIARAQKGLESELNFTLR